MCGNLADNSFSVYRRNSSFNKQFNTKSTKVFQKRECGVALGTLSQKLNQIKSLQRKKLSSISNLWMEFDIFIFKAHLFICFGDSSFVIFMYNTLVDGFRIRFDFSL